MKAGIVLSQAFGNGKSGTLLVRVGLEAVPNEYLRKFATI